MFKSFLIVIVAVLAAALVVANSAKAVKPGTSFTCDGSMPVIIDDCSDQLRTLCEVT